MFPTVAVIILGVAAGVLAMLAGAYCFWRYYWFWRNPPRRPPIGDHVLSPADGVVVYVKEVAPDAPVISLKRGKSASINDIVREDLAEPKVLIGIFMSPFGVHYNRAPIAGVVEQSRQYPSVARRNHNMRSMHYRSVVKKFPIEFDSPHILENNRAVTRFKGALGDRAVNCYVVQIGGGGVHGIDVYPQPGEHVDQGAVFGMIRIGSQVDLVMPQVEGKRVLVRPGERVVAGETILIG